MAFVIQDDFHGFVGVIGDFDEVKVAGADEIMFILHVGFRPFQKAVPIVAAKKDDWKSRDALGLHEREHLKKLVKRAETAGHINETEAVFYEANFAREKIMEMDRDV